MNKKQIITLIVGALLSVLSSQFHFGMPEKDVQDGFIAITFFVYAILAHDANDAQSLLMQKTNWLGALGSIFWIVTGPLHLTIDPTMRTTIFGMIGTLQGYYTMNHSSAVHELQGTVGIPSATFTKE